MVSSVSGVIQLVLRITISVATISGNVLILFVIRKSRQFSQVSRLLITNLAVTDFCYGIFFTFGSFLFLMDAEQHITTCLLATVLTFICGTLNGLGICLIFLDNYLSVRGLSSSKTGLTLKHAQLCVACAWLLAAVHMLASTVPLYSTIDGDQYGHCYEFTIYLTDSSIMMLALAVGYLLILFVIVCLMTLSLHAVNKSMKNLFQSRDKNSTQNELRQRSMKKKSKIAQIFAIVAIGYIISYIPVSVAIIVFKVCDCFAVSLVTNMFSVTPVNACFNIIVYVIKDHIFRADVARILKCKWNQVNPDNSVVTVDTNVS